MPCAHWTLSGRIVSALIFVSGVMLVNSHQYFVFLPLSLLLRCHLHRMSPHLLVFHPVSPFSSQTSQNSPLLDYIVSHHNCSLILVSTLKASALFPAQSLSFLSMCPVNFNTLLRSVLQPLPSHLTFFPSVLLEFSAGKPFTYSTKIMHTFRWVIICCCITNHGILCNPF